ncbi:hypothetical protein J1614_010200 [Plenodomus biglobosus]|nr:hypothetical protein J1614_010200 [Plenodomus biglobosus]
MIMPIVVPREDGVVEQSGVPRLQDSIGNASAETTAGNLIQSDTEFSYYFLVLALLFLVFSAFCYWAHRYWKGHGQGNKRPRGLENNGQDFEMPALRNLSRTADSGAHKSGMSAWYKVTKDKGTKDLEMGNVAMRNIAFKISAGKQTPNPEASPWEAFDGYSTSPFDWNKGLVPLRAVHRLSPEELARRHIPLVVNTTCSGLIPQVGPAYKDRISGHPKAHKSRTTTSVPTMSSQLLQSMVGMAMLRLRMTSTRILPKAESIWHQDS